MPRLRYDHDDDVDDEFADAVAEPHRSRRERRTHTPDEWSEGATERRRGAGRSPRTEADQAFKCGHCRAFIGAPITGGRHRNHCPMCLYSRHVDGKMPGDRRSLCGSLMAPAGQFERRNGEQVILHRCLGCGLERPNRVAADDNAVLLAELPHISSLALAERTED